MEQEVDNRARLLASAGKGFRAKGYAALGVDGIAKEVGLTSGSFYSHYKSKLAIFLASLRSGLRDLAGGIDYARRDGNPAWRQELVDFYLTVRRNCPPEEACALQSMTNDVARLGPEARAVFDEELQEILARMTRGTDARHMTHERQRALALLALLSGAVSLARACGDQNLSDEIIAGARALAKAATDSDSWRG